MVSAGYLFSADWVSLVEDEWRRLLAGLAGRPGLKMLEIGCFEGRATVWLLEHVLTDPTARIHCIDTFAGSAEMSEAGYGLATLEQRFDHNIAISGARHKVLKIKSRSDEALRLLSRGEYDLVYVDGSHVAADVLSDAVLAFPLLKPGGLMFFDDYLWSLMPDPLDRPGPAIDAFLAMYARHYELLGKGLQVYVRKR